MRRVLFILNPKVKRKINAPFVSSIADNLDTSKFSYDLVEWDLKDEASLKHKAEKADVLVAVGGDGTVNFVGGLCLDLGKELAIIPIGSGNGLARHLQIPLQVAPAILLLNQEQIKPIDVIKVNNQFCFNVMGFGFDAHVAHQYGINRRSGFWGYFSEVLLGLVQFKSEICEVFIENKTIQGSFFMGGAANGSQWGYNVALFPKAKIDDGMMDIFLIRKPKISKWPGLLFSFYRKKMEKNTNVEYFKTDHFKLSKKGPITIQIDGEAKRFENEVMISILKKELHIYV